MNIYIVSLPQNLVVISVFHSSLQTEDRMCWAI